MIGYLMHKLLCFEKITTWTAELNRFVDAKSFTVELETSSGSENYKNDKRHKYTLDTLQAVLEFNVESDCSDLSD